MDQLENISDTALWVAVYRAMETERPDAHFRDPLANKLAGKRGANIAANMPNARFAATAIIVRTCVFDEMIMAAIKDRGVKTVINLAAGLDSRPYRLELPADLRWIEVDLPAILEYKTAKLAGETPRCRLERVAVNLLDAPARRAAFASFAAGENSLVLTEGFVVYLEPDQVAGLAKDLRDQLGSRTWILDYCSPRLLEMIRKWRGKELKAANSEMKFAVENGSAYFGPLGWKLREERFGADESIRLDRQPPVPWYYRVRGLFMSAELRQQFRRLSSFTVLERA